jgi:hypothetical protein
MYIVMDVESMAVKPMAEPKGARYAVQAADFNEDRLPRG